ncbi:MAG: CPBP family intramembrane metalloprotease [Clostridia bacterium]|nr:CPBP family intramembrane metalloprotease [Clostridia bacterium]
MSYFDLSEKRVSVPALAAASALLLVLTRVFSGSGLTVRQGFILTVVCEAAVFVIPAVVFSFLTLRRLEEKPSFSEIIKETGFRGFAPSRIRLIVYATILLISGAAILKFVIFRYAYDVSAYSLYGASVSTADPGLSDVLLLTLTFAALPAAVEEYFFRGVVYNGLKEYSRPVGIAVSAILFALLHFEASLLPVYIFAGAVLGWTFSLTGSLFPSMAVHFVFNIYTLFFEKYLWLVSSSSESEALFIFIMTSVFLLALFMFLGDGIRAVRALEKSGELDRNEFPSAATSLTELFKCLISPSFIVCILIFLFGVLALR